MIARYFGAGKIADTHDPHDPHDLVHFCRMGPVRTALVRMFARWELYGTAFAQQITTDNTGLIYS